MSLFTINVNLALRTSSSERPAGSRGGEGGGDGAGDMGLSDGSRPHMEPQALFTVPCAGDPNTGMWPLWALELIGVRQREFHGSSELST